MCGICGKFKTKGPADVAAVVRMNEHMHDRGPDGNGVWVQGPSPSGIGG